MKSNMIISMRGNKFVRPRILLRNVDVLDGINGSIEFWGETPHSFPVLKLHHVITYSFHDDGVTVKGVFISPAGEPELVTVLLTHFNTLEELN